MLPNILPRPSAHEAEDRRPSRYTPSNPLLCTHLRRCLLLCHTACQEVDSVSDTVSDDNDSKVVDVVVGVVGGGGVEWLIVATATVAVRTEQGRLPQHPQSPESTHSWQDQGTCT